MAKYVSSLCTRALISLLAGGNTKNLLMNVQHLPKDVRETKTTYLNETVFILNAAFSFAALLLLKALLAQFMQLSGVSFCQTCTRMLDCRHCEEVLAIELLSAVVEV